MKFGLAAPIEDILADPRYFPVHIDFERDRLTLVETSRDRLTHTPFLDGRTPFAEGIALETSFSEALEARWSIPARPDRFIFHVAFCGSTLLSTFLDIESKCFAEREPHILVELSNAWGKAAASEAEAGLQLIRNLLRRPWRPGEANVCKPSNWANTLIPTLVMDPQSIRPLFVTTDKLSYLHSLFRGGRDRMVYVIRAAEHLLKSAADGSTLWHHATAGVADPLERAGRIALVALHLQLRLFEAALSHGGWGPPHVLTLDEIEADPVAACLTAAAALDLQVTERELERSVAARAQRYAKDPSINYSPEQVAAQNRAIDAEYGVIIHRVLDWAALRGLKGSITYEMDWDRRKRA